MVECPATIDADEASAEVLADQEVPIRPDQVALVPSLGHPGPEPSLVHTHQFLRVTERLAPVVDLEASDIMGIVKMVV